MYVCIFGSGLPSFRKVDMAVFMATGAQELLYLGAFLPCIQRKSETAFYVNTVVLFFSCCQRSCVFRIPCCDDTVSGSVPCKGEVFRAHHPGREQAGGKGSKSVLKTEQKSAVCMFPAEMEIAVQDLKCMFRYLPGIPFTAVGQFFKEFPLPWIYKSRTSPQHGVPSRRLERIDKAVLCHPLLAGSGKLLLEKSLCTCQTHLGEDRTFPHLTLKSTVLQTDPQDTVKSLAHERDADCVKEFLHDLPVIPFPHISDDRVHVQIRISILGKCHECRFKTVFSCGCPYDI